MSDLGEPLMSAYGGMGVSKRMDRRVSVHKSVLRDGFPVASGKGTN